MTEEMMTAETNTTLTIVTYQRHDGTTASQCWQTPRRAEATLRQIARNGWTLIGVETVAR